jgi:hypothetical protein
MPPAQSEEKKVMINDFLGLDIDSHHIQKKLRKIFICEMIRLTPFYIKTNINMLFSSLRNVGVFRTIRRVWRYF